MPTPVTRPRVNASCRSCGERIGLELVPWDAQRVRSGLLAERNGRSTQHRADRGPELQTAEQAPLIAGCAGWGARELVPDPSVRPVRGQEVIVDNPGLEVFFISAPFAPAWTTYCAHRAHRDGLAVADGGAACAVTVEAGSRLGVIRGARWHGYSVARCRRRSGPSWRSRGNRRVFSPASAPTRNARRQLLAIGPSTATRVAVGPTRSRPHQPRRSPRHVLRGSPGTRARRSGAPDAAVPASAGQVSSPGGEGPSDR
jgi:hypothetical protein